MDFSSVDFKWTVLGLYLEQGEFEKAKKILNRYPALQERLKEELEAAEALKCPEITETSYARLIERQKQDKLLHL